MTVPDLLPAGSLLYPAWRGVANRVERLDRNGRAKVGAILLMVLGVWIGLYVGIAKLLGACYSVELFGEYLVDRLLALFFLSFSGILLFSNIVTSLATFYLSDDLPIVNGAPVDTLRIFYAKLVETVFGSSWMVLLFGAPVLLAYGTVHHAGALYYVATAVLAPAYFLIPAAIGILLVTILVNVFPARRARDFLMILGIVFLGLAFLLFRAIRPERLVDPNAFSSLAEFFGSLSVPQAEWLPSSWITKALGSLMRGRSGWLEPAYEIVLTAAAAIVLVAWTTSRLYFSGWSKAQEGRRAAFRRFEGKGLVRVASAILGAKAGAILAKDARTFFRDAGQWSQLLLLLALIGVYLMSIKALPFEALNFPTGPYRNAVAYLNLGMGGFVLAALGARFLFPSVSAEGRGIWILRAAPMSGRELVRAKFFAGVWPLALVGELLSLCSSWLLQASPFIVAESALTTLAIAVGVSGLAVGLGARMPDYKAENLAKVAAGFGGLVFMASALTYIGAAVALEAYPTWLIYDVSMYHYRLADRQLALAAVCYAAVLALSIAVAVRALSMGADAIESREYA